MEYLFGTEKHAYQDAESLAPNTKIASFTVKVFTDHVYFTYCDSPPLTGPWQIRLWHKISNI